MIVFLDIFDLLDKICNMIILFILKNLNVCKEYYVGKKEMDFDYFFEGGGVFVFIDYGRFFFMMKCFEYFFVMVIILN